MSDPHGQWGNRGRFAGPAEDDWARNAGYANDASGQPAPDAWADVYGRRPPPHLPTKRRSLRGLAWTLSILIPLVAINEVSYVVEFFTREPEVLGEDSLHLWLTFGFFYPLADGALQLVSFLAVAVATGLFIAWQFRHAKNAQVLGQVQGLGPGWAIGGWFIPVANLILPVIQLTQSSSASDPPPNRYRGESRTALVVLWAIVFYLSLLEISLASSDPATARTGDTISGLLGMLSIPAAWLAVVMIWQLTKRQERALDAQGATGPPLRRDRT